MRADLIQCSDDKLPLVTIIVTSLAHLVDADTRYKRIIGLMNQDTRALSILQLELSVYFNRSLFWASNDSSDLAKCVEAFGFMLAWPTTALALLGGWSMNLNGDIWGWVRAIKGFAMRANSPECRRKPPYQSRLPMLWCCLLNEEEKEDLNALSRACARRRGGVFSLLAFLSSKRNATRR